MYFLPKKWLLWLLVILSAPAIYLYYNYLMQGIPERIAQASETIINVDKIRFSFKVSLLSQKGFSSYTFALVQQDEEKLYESLDYLEASLGFLDIKYTQSNEQKDYIQPRLEEAIALIERYQLNMPRKEWSRLQDLVHEIYSFSEQRERNIWSEVQNDYIDFQTNEYKLNQLYKIAVVVALILFSLSFWMYIKQNRQNQLIRKHESELRSLAFFDPLTAIPNRKHIENLLETQLNRALRHEKHLFIALIDIDNFKKINDLLGHDAGDRLLVESVERILEQIRQEDTLGRLGGDEFLIIFDESLSSEEALTYILDRILGAFKRPIRINNTDFMVSLSIGIAMAPDNSRRVEELMKYADIAMYQSKQLGKDQYQFYDQALSRKLQEEHKLDLEIKQALLNDEFELFYQPQIDISGNKIIGAEALVRWNHPQKGLLFPGEFIDLIERGVHTREFGSWVIIHAAQQQKVWQSQGINIPVSINLSVKHILVTDFYESMCQLIKDHDIDLKSIVFEITEYEVIEHQSSAIETLKKLKDVGFVFHLDDFGTGYSSISYLNKLPIEAIKIDKSFIDYIQPGNEQKQMVDAIIHIGHALDMSIIAEGVEETYQMEYLAQHGCAMVQGYLFAKPLPKVDFEDFFKRFGDQDNGDNENLNRAKILQ